MFRKTLVIALFVVAVFAEYDVETIRESIKQRVSDLCKANGAEDKTDDVVNAVVDFSKCIKTQIDPTTVNKEIEEAKPTGALDEVFKKYCAKAPEVKTCISTLITGVTPCVDAAYRPQLAEGTKTSDSLIDFVCHKDGDRIAMFIAEGGPECFTTKADELKQCAEKLKDSVPSVEEAKKLTEAERCTKFDELTACAVKALEGCSSPTPANMVDSLVRYVRPASCKK